ncbi:MAG TPA: hypothetical protein VI757_11075 [Bacteroidia bacterium]|nr:hypothetical protein [Bacteroidia bacterium]
MTENTFHITVYNFKLNYFSYAGYNSIFDMNLITIASTPPTGK